MAKATEKVGMPLEAFIEESNDQPFELINGERRPWLPELVRHSEIRRLLLQLLHRFTRPNDVGEVYSKTTYIVLDNDDAHCVEAARIPDLMFFAGDRIASYKTEHPNYRAPADAGSRSGD